MPEQPKVPRNLVIRMLWSVVSKAADRSSNDKIDTQPRLKPDADHLLHAIKLSQCCDTFSRQIGMALEGCETVNADKNCFRTIRSSTFDKNGKLDTECALEIQSSLFLL